MFKGYTFPQFHCIYVFSMVVKINSTVVKINFQGGKNQFSTMEKSVSMVDK